MCDSNAIGHFSVTVSALSHREQAGWPNAFRSTSEWGQPRSGVTVQILSHSCEASRSLRNTLTNNLQASAS